jgi:tetratricopeptide (TPR) repeat protein
MWQEHYDEAIDRFQEALTRSRALAATDAESRSLGNLGWSHWVIGDFDAALLDLSLAEEKAGQAGLNEDQTYWLWWREPMLGGNPLRFLCCRYLRPESCKLW